eukprot:CAMPEP_0184505416 /NCGR_PEP_ID=MMETSP0113_2-20130426/52976_1 /TAXON_ID=91329 /ORGANISM="Norrisiella sphaerica, Strain BC52" /LENGTH=113 /DNA_ID=CAMNT_0026895105 /DNA_START=1479 /DNA_END=1816 /DNA_ORIENTATION=-
MPKNKEEMFELPVQVQFQDEKELPFGRPWAERKHRHVWHVFLPHGAKFKDVAMAMENAAKIILDEQADFFKRQNITLNHSWKIKKMKCKGGMKVIDENLNAPVRDLLQSGGGT